MQLTLVSHYGQKPAVFAELICELQQMTAAAIGSLFRPYAVEQVHGTIVGLEGTHCGEEVRAENFLRLCGEERWFDFTEMLHFLRHEFRPFEVQIGGFRVNDDYPFLSQGKHPFLRSFSLQGSMVVAMGWPRERQGFPPLLDQLRRRLESFGALRKWAWREGEVDNDFYFVLGRIDGALAQSERLRVEDRVREHLSARPPLSIFIDRETLAFIGYCDLELSPGASRVFKVNAENTTPEQLVRIYQAA